MGKTLRKAPLLQNENNDLYCIDILYKSLQEFHIPEYLCSVGEYAEEAICLEKSGSDWIVYGGERGLKHDLRPYEDCRDACLDVLSRLSETTDEEKRICQFFDHFIVPSTGTEESKPRVHAAFR